MTRMNRFDWNGCLFTCCIHSAALAPPPLTKKKINTTNKLPFTLKTLCFYILPISLYPPSLSISSSSSTSKSSSPSSPTSIFPLSFSLIAFTSTKHVFPFFYPPLYTIVSRRIVAAPKVFRFTLYMTTHHPCSSSTPTGLTNSRISSVLAL